MALVSYQAHGLLDSGSSTSFISEGLAQTLFYPPSTFELEEALICLSVVLPYNMMLATFSIYPLLLRLYSEAACVTRRRILHLIKAGKSMN